MRHIRAIVAAAALALLAPPASAATLLGSWNFNNSATPLDSTPSGNSLTVASGAPAYTSSGAPGLGGGMSFNGSTDVLAGAGLATDSSAGGYNSVSFWMNWTGGSYPMPFSWGGANYDLYLYGGAFGFNTFGGDVVGISNTGLASNWVFVSAVFRNGSTNLAADNALYINGVRQSISVLVAGSGTIARTVGSSFLLAGYPGYGTDFFFGGNLDEVRVFSGALTQSDVTALYNNTYGAAPEPDEMALALGGLVMVAGRLRSARLTR